jgi:hypothetical protein
MHLCAVVHEAGEKHAPCYPANARLSGHHAGIADNIGTALAMSATALQYTSFVRAPHLLHSNDNSIPETQEEVSKVF